VALSKFKNVGKCNATMYLGELECLGTSASHLGVLSALQHQIEYELLIFIFIQSIFFTDMFYFGKLLCFKGR
jgi:hypothetical protein